MSGIGVGGWCGDAHVSFNAVEIRANDRRGVGAFDGDSYGGYHSIQLPVQPSIAQHYLAIGGVQPLVPENPRVRHTSTSHNS